MERKSMGRQLEEIKEAIHEEAGRRRLDSLKIMMLLSFCFLMAAMAYLSFLKLNQVITARLFKRRIYKDKHYREGIREEDLELEDY